MPYPLTAKLPYVAKPPLGAPLCAGHPLARGLLHDWLCDEGAGGKVRDAVTGAVTGASANVAWTDASALPPALQFGGNGYVVTAATDQLLDFTCAVWYRSTSGANGGNHRLVDKDYAAGFWLGCSTAGNYGGGIQQTGAPYGLFVAQAEGQDHQLVLVRRGATQYVYGDGGAQSATQACSASACGAQALTIGDDTALGANMVFANVARVMLYGRALSLAEVAQLFLAPFSMFLTP